MARVYYGEHALDEFEIAKLTFILSNKIENGQESGCILWKGTLKDGYGIIRKKLSCCKERVSLRCHRLTYILFHRPGWEEMENLDVSHLCHEKTCINIDHLSLERHTINNNRLRCKKKDDCIGHVDKSDCVLI